MSIVVAEHKRFRDLETIVMCTDSQISGDDTKETAQKLFGFGNYLITSTGDEELFQDVIAELSDYLHELASSQKVTEKLSAVALARQVLSSVRRRVSRKFLGITFGGSEYKESDFLIAGPARSRQDPKLALYLIEWEMFTNGGSPLRIVNNFGISGSGRDLVEDDEDRVERNGLLNYGNVKDVVTLLIDAYGKTKMASGDLYVDRDPQIGVEVLSARGIETCLVFPDNVNLSAAGISDAERRVNLFTGYKRFGGTGNLKDAAEKARWLNEFYRVLMEHLEEASDLRRALATELLGNPARNRLEAVYSEAVEKAAVAVNALLSGKIPKVQEAVRRYHSNFK